MGKNKVKYGLKNVHYAKHTVSAAGVVSFGTPVPIKGAVDLALDAEGEITPFYADGIVYYQSSSNNGYAGDLEVALIPESFRTDCLGETLDTQNVLVENANAKASAFALLFEFEGDTSGIKHCLYNCTASRPSMASKTTEGSIDPSTEKLTISAVGMENGLVKAKTGDTTDATVANAWYTSVYVPEAPAV